MVNFLLIGLIKSHTRNLELIWFLIKSFEYKIWNEFFETTNISFEVESFKITKFGFLLIEKSNSKATSPIVESFGNIEKFCIRFFLIKYFMIKKEKVLISLCRYKYPTKTLLFKTTK